MKQARSTCAYCSAHFNGYGDTKSEAQADADGERFEHEPVCSLNPINEEEE